MADRPQRILEQLEQQGACGYQELADLLGVSTMTVRRDIDELARGGAVIKTLGGAQRASAPSHLYETTLKSRLQSHRAEKRAIALAALELVKEGQTLFLDGGTTCLEFARLLAKRKKGLTVVTNSALVSLEMGHNADNMIVAIGGQLDPASASFVGPSSEDWAGRFFVDVAVVSTKGFVAAEGTFESSMGMFRIKQIIARQARQVVLLADHSKFGQRALCRVLDIDQIHTIVTDPGVSETEIAELRSADKKVLVAGRTSEASLV